MCDASQLHNEMNAKTLDSGHWWYVVTKVNTVTKMMIGGQILSNVFALL